MEKLKGKRNNYKTKAEAIYETLRVQIMDGTLKPGERLILSKIAGDMETSEIPVREAIKRLEVEHLVKVIPHSGATVTGISADGIIDIYAIRAVLEGLAAKLAAQVITQKDILHLEALMESMEGAYSSGRISDFARSDKEFHLSIYSVISNKRLYQMIINLWNETQRARSVFNLRSDRMSAFLLDHRNLLEALKEANEELAESIVKQHRLDVAKALIEYDQTILINSNNLNNGYI